MIKGEQKFNFLVCSYRATTNQKHVEGKYLNDLVDQAAL